ncbi:MAG: hypothetical protein KJ070_04055 [Verrucomicrobia bacterium]|nr:hypothetical protein [Verrucomicrobiota bacterium]
MKSKLRVKPTPAIAVLVCALLGGFGKPAQADEPFVQWANTASNLNAVTICSAPGGGVLSAPRNTLLRFDADGHLVASNAIPFFEAYEIQTDTTGAIYCAGIDNHTFSVAKLNPDGTLIWKTNASNPQPGLYHGADALAINSTGSVYAIGVFQGPVSFGDASFAEGNGLLLSRLDQDGRVLWAKRILDAEQGPAHSLDLDPNGNIIFSGYLPPNGPMDFLGTIVYPGATQNHSGFGGDFFVAKCDPDGKLLWVRVGDLHLNDTLTDTKGMCSAVDRQGNTYYLEGAKWLGKLDPSGNLLWSKSFPGAYLRQSLGIAIDADDEPVFCGQIGETVSFDAIQLRSPTSDAQGFFLAKSDTNGNIRWALAGGSSSYDSPGRVTSDALGSVFLGATINAAGSFDGLALPSRPDVYGQTSMLTKLSERPQLRITNVVGLATITYPAKATNYVLEAATLLPAVSWSTVTNTSTVSGRDRRVQLPATGNAQFFRLRQP